MQHNSNRQCTGTEKGASVLRCCKLVCRCFLRSKIKTAIIKRGFCSLVGTKVALLSTVHYHSANTVCVRLFIQCSNLECPDLPQLELGRNQFEMVDIGHFVWWLPSLCAALGQNTRRCKLENLQAIKSKLL